jgi:DNA-binding MarR family transcriptional regulator
MAILLPKKIPRYECLLRAAQTFPDLDPSACDAYLHLVKAGSDAMHGSEAYFASHDLSQGRFTVLMLLLDKLENRPIARTPAELADLANVTRATMTGLIDTLERDGLVTREPDPEDGRMMTVRLNPKGHALLDRVLPGHFKQMAALMAPLSEAERKTLVRLIRKFSDFGEGADADCAAAAPATHHRHA